MKLMVLLVTLLLCRGPNGSVVGIRSMPIAGNGSAEGGDRQGLGLHRREVRGEVVQPVAALTHPVSS